MARGSQATPSRNVAKKSTARPAQNLTKKEVPPKREVSSPGPSSPSRSPRQSPRRPHVRPTFTPRVLPRKQARKKNYRDDSPVIKKPKHRRPAGTLALQEIRRYQRAVDLLIPKLAFSRLVKEVTQKFKSDFRYKPLAIQALQPLKKSDGNRVEGPQGVVRGPDGQILLGPDGKPVDGANILYGPDGKPVLDKNGRAIPLNRHQETLVLGPDGLPVLGPDGLPMYSKQGGFLTNPDGTPVLDKNGDPIPLVTSQGQLVLGPDGLPVLGPDGLPQYSNQTQHLRRPDGTPVLDQNGDPIPLTTSQGTLVGIFVLKTKMPFANLGGVHISCQVLIALG